MILLSIIDQKVCYFSTTCRFESIENMNISKVFKPYIVLLLSSKYKIVKIVGDYVELTFNGDLNVTAHSVTQ